MKENKRNSKKASLENNTQVAVENVSPKPKPSPEILTAMLAEYSELRQEIRESQSKQTGMISLYATVMASVFALAASLYSDKPKPEMYSLVTVVFFALIPTITSFIGALWLDHVYRQVKLGVYVSTMNKPFVQLRRNRSHGNGMGALGKKA